MFLSLVSLTLVVFVDLFSWGYKDILDERDYYPPGVEAGKDIITYTGISTKFKGFALSHDFDIVKWEWDFDGDGIFDWQSHTSSEVEYSYPNPGTYLAKLRAWDDNGMSGETVLKVIVRSGMGEQEYVKPSAPLPKVAGCSAPDGDFRRFAVLLTGFVEYWYYGSAFYDSLVSVYEFNENEIFLLYGHGLDSSGQEDDRIYDSLTYSSIERLFEMLADTIDSDDKLYVWLFGHGIGYDGPERAYLGSRATVDPEDEEDYRESEFKLESFYVGGEYAKHLGMEEWGFRYKSSYPGYWYQREQYVSHFDSVYFELYGWQSDHDSLIEKFIDRPLADTNHNWRIDSQERQLLDWDEDGNPPYDSLTGLFDEDDWGNVDTLQQDYYELWPVGDSFLYYPGPTYWDSGLDNHVDIDLEYDSTKGYEVDGTDVDGQGRFDWIDANDDGDTTDWVSIDEEYMISVSRGLYDDDLRDLLNNICANTIVVIPQQCYSGGFIEDLSKSGRVIFTNSGEEELSSTMFTEALLKALMWYEGVDADTNNDGCVSMVEAFNYAAEYNSWYNDFTSEFDDDGDGIGHAYPIPNSTDGDFGQYTFLQKCDGLDYVYGDANDDESVNVVDMIYLNNYLFYAGLPPLPWAAGDPNSSCDITIADIVYLNNYLFKSGPAPLEGCIW